jgi:hypothetical protein
MTLVELIASTRRRGSRAVNASTSSATADRTLGDSCPSDEQAARRFGRVPARSVLPLPLTNVLNQFSTCLATEKELDYLRAAEGGRLWRIHSKDHSG